MKHKNWKDYFHFSKFEKYGIYFVIAAILFVASLNIFIPRLITHSSIDFSEFKADIEKLKIKNKSKNDDASQQVDFDKLNAKDYTLFKFDPNDASKEDFFKLGMKTYVISNLLKYRNKGGRFKKKEDLKKIFGFDLETYKRLEPYIIIKENNADHQRFKKYEDNKADKETLQIDINNSTAAELQEIKGIGATFSKRIVDYRTLLGGYDRIEQIAEVYGIDSTLFNSIKDQLVIHDIELQQISLNFATIKELSAHPYINYALAKKIYNDRVENGPYKTIDELNIRCVEDNALFEKISPYLKVWD